MKIDPESKKDLMLTISSARAETTVFSQLCTTTCTKHIPIKTEIKKFKKSILQTASCRVGGI